MSQVPDSPIRVLNRWVDLPATLMRCPKCGRGDLAWDDHWAWRCNSPHRWFDAMHQEHRCQYGFAFSGLFECDDLEHIVSVGKPLAGLRPSHYAIELQRHGVISLPWMPRRLETKGGGA